MGNERIGPRRMWQLLEVVHAVVYFAPEVGEAFTRAGLKGYWMGYFAGRAAPMGEASPELVTATFFNFHPSRPARALPDAWRFATPEQVLAARLDGVSASLSRLLGPDVLASDQLAEAAELAADAAGACSIDGRPLFAANTALDWPTPPHLKLWHAATLLREHRGDGHIAANVCQGFSGLDAHLMLCATGAVDRPLMQRSRGWSEEEWDAAADRLYRAGLLDEEGRLSHEGAARRRAVEDTTDTLAEEPWDHLGDEPTRRLADLLEPLAASIVASDVIMFPNPMGLPRPT